MAVQKRFISILLSAMLALGTASPVYAENEHGIQADASFAEQVSAGFSENAGGWAVPDSIAEEALPGTAVPESADEGFPSDAAASKETEPDSSLSEEAVSDSAAGGAELPSDGLADRESEDSVPETIGTAGDDSLVSVLPDTSALEEAVGAAALKDGLYTIATTDARPLMMSIQGNKAAAGANIQLGSYTSSNVRLFNIKSLGNGIYTICSLHTGMYVGAAADGNVQQYEKVTDDGQKWFVEKNADGSFLIQTADKKKSLTAASNASGANISAAENPAGSVFWKIEPAKKLISGDVAVCTYNKSVEKDANGKVVPPAVKVTLYGRTLVKDKDYTEQVSMSGDKGTITLKGIGDYAGTKKLTFDIYSYPLKEGIYKIYTTASADKPMVCIKGNSTADKANVQLGSFAGSNVRLFSLKKTGDGCYYITSFCSGKYLTAEGTLNGANISQSVLNNTAAQKWSIQPSGSNYRIRAGSSGGYLTASRAGSGVNIALGDGKTGVSAWKIESAKKYISGSMTALSSKSAVDRGDDGTVRAPAVTLTVDGVTLKQNRDFTVQNSAGTDKGTITIRGAGDYTGTRTVTYTIYNYPFAEGTYRIYAAGVSERPMICIKGNSSADKANVQLGTYADSNVRLFSFEKTGDGNYYIQNLNSGKYLTAEGSSAGSNISQSALVKTAQQKWKAEVSSNGCRFKNAAGGKYLTASKTDTSSNIALGEMGAKVNSWMVLTSKRFLAGDTVTWTYSGTASYDPVSGRYGQPEVTGKLFGRTLIQGKDFSAEYRTDTDKGTGTIILVGIGDYEGRRTLNYTLSERNTCSGYELNRTLTGRRFLIKPYQEQDMMLAQDSANALVTAPSTSAAEDSFVFVRTSSDGYKILFGDNSSCIASREDLSASVYVGKQDNSTRQLWYPIRNDDDTNSILHIKSGYAMTLVNGCIRLQPFRGQDNQKFVLEEKVTPAFSDQPALPTKIDTYMSDYRFEWGFRLDNVNSKLYLTREGTHATLQDVSSGVMCDMEAGTLSILAAFKNFNEGSMNILTTLHFSSIKPKAGGIYVLSLERRDTFAITAELKDVSTGKSEKVSHKGYGAGRGWGKTYTHIVGKAASLDLKGYSTKKPASSLAIVGDSYAEAATLRDDYMEGYANLVDLMYDGTVPICTKGGAHSSDALTWLKQYFLEVARPGYMIIEIGMNDRDYNAWLKDMKEMISLLETNGITPVLATIPPVVANSAEVNATHRKMSDWVLNSGYMYLDFEYVMSADNDRVNADANNTISDGIHPTVSCHRQVSDLFFEQFGRKLV